MPKVFWICLSGVLLAGQYCAAQASRPLPDAHALMAAARAHQKELARIRENYTCTIEHKQEVLDGSGHVSKTETSRMEMFYVSERPITRLLVKDGKPLDANATQKEDNRVAHEIEKATKKQENADENPANMVDLLQILDAAEASNPRRVVKNGRDAIAFDFVGRKQHAHGINEDLARVMQGTVWIDEDARQVMQLDVSFADNFHIGGGLLVDVQKGSHFHFEQGLQNGEIWLPTAFDLQLNARVLLLKKIRAHVTEQLHDYKRFQVDAEQGKQAQAIVNKK